MSLVDAGTVELIRAQGCKVVSSADLVQEFEAAWTPEQLESHRAAGREIDRITQAAFAEAARRVRAGEAFTEYDLQQWILGQFRASGVTSDSPPDRRRRASRGRSALRAAASEVRRPCAKAICCCSISGAKRWRRTASTMTSHGSDIWARKFPQKYAKIFSIVRDARDAAVDFVQQKCEGGRAIEGWQVDRAAREVIRKAGYAKYFVHRTGHNIGQEVHGTGANMDGLETHDVRRVIPHTCFSDRARDLPARVRHAQRSECVRGRRPARK